MAKPLRIEFAGALYHLTSRGDRREAIYEDDVALNPVRAGMVALSEEWPWSSYRAMAGIRHRQSG